MWKEHLTESLPPMQPKAVVVRRTIALVGEKNRPWIAVHDYLKTDGPAEFDYMLHSLEEMELDPEQGRIVVRHGDAVLDIYLLCGSELDFRQCGRFPVAPEERYEGAPEQWHLTAQTLEKTDEIKFLAVMVPRRESEKPLEVTAIDRGDSRGFQVGQEKVLAWWGEGETGGQSRLLIEYFEKGEMKKKKVQ